MRNSMKAKKGGNRMNDRVKRRLFIAAYAGLLMAIAGPAAAASYGAIAISPDSGATGWSHGYSSRSGAEAEAQQNCDGYADDCQVALWFKDACGAVARGSDGWGSGWGNNQRRAEHEALKSCARHSDECRVIRWQCSGAR